MRPAREPILNVPAVIVLVLLLLCVIHAVRVLILSEDMDQLVLLLFSFIPARYDQSLLLDGLRPGGTGAKIWTFITYAFLHADLTHLGFNAIWLVAFGSPLARRFGALRFLALFVATVAAGALAHLVMHAGERSLVIGASAAISGMMGAASRFVFQRGGPLDRWRPDASGADRIPAAPIFVALRNPRVMTFVGVWFAFNLLFGIRAMSIVGEDQNVAWEAHVGGFVAGMLLFSLFDPVRQATDVIDEPPPL